MEIDSSICAKCTTEMAHGKGELWVVKIAAFADPSPPNFEIEEEKDLRTEIKNLVEQLEGTSEREAMDQVHRSLVLHLCDSCYRQWIENPTG